MSLLDGLKTVETVFFKETKVSSSIVPNLRGGTESRDGCVFEMWRCDFPHTADGGFEVRKICCSTQPMHHKCFDILHHPSCCLLLAMLHRHLGCL